MPLQGDQRALLQLLCERGQSYEDIAGLLGGTPDDVRERARAALVELGGADPDAEVGLTDYLLGQADPIGRADAVRHLQSDPGALDLAGRIATSLRLVAPGANLPKLPEARSKRRRAAVPAPGDASAASPARTGDPGPIEARSTAGGGGSRFGDRQSAVFAALGAAALILLVVILAVAGAFGGDEDSADSAPVAETPAATDSTTATTPEATAQNLTKVDLKGVNGSGVAGTAEFGIVDNSQVYVDVDIAGLDPKAPQTSTSFIWLMVGEQNGYPLNQPLVPDQNGGFSGRIAVPTPVASTVGANATAVKISLSSIRELAAAVEDAAARQQPIVQFTGTELATGNIPLAEPENP